MRFLWLAVAILAGTSGDCQAQPSNVGKPTEGLLCRAAVAAAEKATGVPAHLLAAISRVESGRRDASTGAVHPWPWTVNAEGQGYFYDTKAQAIAAVRAMQADGIRSIDVGCGQVNLMHHPTAFPNLEAAFDPQANTAYAARFLKELFARTGDWNKATGLYHSATPELADDYRQKVLAVLPEEQRSSLPVASPLAQAWNATVAAPPTGFMRIMRTDPIGMQQTAHVIMQRPVAGMIPPGRGLDAYRAQPIGLAFQPPPRRVGG
ncbi:MAG TPA: lytic transglycosylase domain-containing protein [Acetobacteraceae bacterium]|nr:lytic transglycosylase domain-containing protein [Acetobacteraceae bacterium]